MKKKRPGWIIKPAIYLFSAAVFIRLAWSYYNFKVFLVPQSHIDVAWLWTKDEASEKAKTTFSSVLGLMDKYQGFGYSQSNAIFYEWMEQRHPQIFNEIKKRVKEKRWEPVGGMWVESDTNMPSGESLVRQIFYGKRYFKDKLGVDVKVGWLPDTFGFSHQMPQIFKKSGIDYFMTQKLSINDTNGFPHKSFNWRSPDGSSVVSHIPPPFFLDSTNALKVLPYLLKSFIKGQKAMVLYGYSDGGGGPSEGMAGFIERLLPFKKPLRFEQAGAEDFFGEIAGERQPVWYNELYLENHRGSYTSQAWVKKTNRLLEARLRNAELFSAISWLYGGAYPSEDIDNAWKGALANQFHDIIAGTSISQVYRDAGLEYKGIERALKAIQGSSERRIASAIDTQGAGVPLIVFNALAWERSGVVGIESRALAGEGFLIADDAGNTVRHQTTGNKILFFADKVPSLGYKVFRIIRAGASTKARRGFTDAGLRATRLSLENSFLRIEIDENTGFLKDIIDKRNGFTVLNGPGNSLELFRDEPKDYDAWNISKEDMSRKPLLMDRPENIELLEQGDVFAKIRVTKRFEGTIFLADIVLYRDCPALFFENTVFWAQRHHLLKAAFPVNVKAGFATYEIPYGTIRRSTGNTSPAESAQFEVPGQRFADLSSPEYGVSLLNDSKYGYDVKGNTMRLTLLRGPEYPDKEADLGWHEFSYALYPHEGGFFDSNALRSAQEMNNPFIAFLAGKHNGALPRRHSFMGIDNKDIVLEVIKKSHDREAIVLRLYEAGGVGGEATVKVGTGLHIKSAFETDLLEKSLFGLKHSDQALLLKFKPFEIKTVELSFEKTIH